MKDRGLFDEEERLKVLSKLGDNLETLNKKINNEQIKHRLFSAAKMARSSNNVHPCTLFDSEFWLKPKYRYCYHYCRPWR